MAVNDYEPLDYPEANPPPGPISSAMESAPTEVPVVTPSTREVQGNELVSNQMNDLLSDNSAYIRNARANSLQYMIGRGGQNTTMAAEAGEKGAITAALPIATSDAQAYRSAASANQAETGAASRLTATMANTAYSNRQLGEINASAAEMGFEYDTGLQNRQAEIDAALAEGQFNYDEILSRMDLASREKIAQMQIDFQELTSTNNDAALIVRGTLASVAAIVTTPGITKKEITRATDIVYDKAHSALVVMGSDLSDIFPSIEETGTASAAAEVNGTQLNDAAIADYLARQQREFDATQG